MSDLKRHALSLFALGVFAFLAVGSLPDGSGSSSKTTSPPAPEPQVTTPAEPPRPARQLSPREHARINYAEVLQLVYKREGRLISVNAKGEKLDTLELQSVLITEGTYTLDAARRETIECPECMRMMKQLGFKTLVITGTNFHEAWDIQH